MDRRALAGLIVATSVVACALFPSLGDLAGDGGGGGNDANDVNTASDANEAGDASIDVSDAGPDVPAAPGSWCATVDAAVAFCEDYDESDAGTFPKWSKVNTIGGGTIVRIASDASSPFAAEFTVPLPANGVQANMQRTFVSAPTTFARYTFDLRVVQYPTNGSFNVAPVALNGNGGTGVVDALALKGATTNFVEQLAVDGGSTIAHVLTSSPALGQWVHVRIDWIITGTITAQVFFDGSPVSAPITLDPSSAFDKPPAVTAGISFESPSANGASIDVDNVTFEMQ